MVETAAIIWADGPSTSPSQPDKTQIRAWGTWLESFFPTIGSNSGVIFTTKTDLASKLTFAANTMAWVIGDAVVANNGIYMKIGSTGSGSWTRVGDLPYSFITANVVSGADSAISVSTFTPISEQALITFRLTATNASSPVTVSFNNGSPLTIKTNTGFDPDSGALRAGMTLAGFVVGSEFRLLTDNIASSILTSMETLHDAAESAADTATTEAAAAQSAATAAATYAEIVGAAAFDFNFDSDPATPGYDWND